MFNNPYLTTFNQQPVFPQLPTRQPMVAILLDAENIHSDHLEFIVDKAQHYGVVTIRRAYGDWSSVSVRHYAGRLNKFGFTAIHHFATHTGKNSSDMMLSVDAMNLMYQPNRPDVVVLATSDSDFTTLAVKLRELGVRVVGVGNGNSAQFLTDACDVFYCIPNTEEGMVYSSVPPPRPKPTQWLKPRVTPPSPLKEGQIDPNQDPKLIRALNDMFGNNLIATNNNKAHLGEATTVLAKQGFYPSDYGFADLFDLTQCLNEFEIFTAKSGTLLLSKCFPFAGHTNAQSNTGGNASSKPAIVPRPAPTPAQAPRPVPQPTKPAQSARPVPQPRATAPTPIKDTQTNPNHHQKLIEVLNHLFNTEPMENRVGLSMGMVGERLVSSNIRAKEMGFATLTEMVECMERFEVFRPLSGGTYIKQCLPFEGEIASTVPSPVTPEPQPTPVPAVSLATAMTPLPVETPVQTQAVKRLLAGQKDPNNHKKLVETLHHLFDSKPNKDKIDIAEIGSKLKSENILASDLGFGSYSELLEWLDDFELIAEGKTRLLARTTAPDPKPAPVSVKAPQELDLAFKNAVAFAIANQQDENGWARVGKVSVAILTDASISAIQYGYNTLSDAIKACDIFELYAHEVGGVKNDYVRDTRTTPDELADKIPAALVQTVKPVISPAPSVVSGNEETLEKSKYQPEHDPASSLKHQPVEKPVNEPVVKSAAATTEQNQAKNPPVNPKSTQPHQANLDAGTVAKLRQAILDLMQETYKGDVWFAMADIGNDFRKKGYNPKDYGSKTLGVLMAKMGGYETKTVDTTSFVKDPNFVPKQATQSVENIETKQKNQPKDNSDAQVAKTVEKTDVVEVQKSAQIIENIETEHKTLDDSLNKVAQLVTDTTDKTSEVIAVIEVLENQADETNNTKEIASTPTTLEIIETEELVVGSDEPVNEEGEFGVADLLILINQAIELYQDDDGYTKVGDIGKYVRKEIGLGAQSFGYADFGKMLELFPQYEIARQGRAVVVRLMA